MKLWNYETMKLWNIWLFKPVLSWFLARKPTTAAMIRTVTSVTMFNAGVKHNVIPPYAEAVVNHRIHPSQTVEEVLAYDRSLIGDSRVNMEIISSMEPHPTAGYGEGHFGYQVMKTSIGQIWPEALVVPGIMVGNTDTRFYLNFTCNVYRFAPTHMFPGDPERFHGINERISEVNYEQVINFFYHLIRNCDQAKVSSTHKHHDLWNGGLIMFVKSSLDFILTLWTNKLIRIILFLEIAYDQYTNIIVNAYRLLTFHILCWFVIFYLNCWIK